jgi:hypothetical protein
MESLVSTDVVAIDKPLVSLDEVELQINDHEPHPSVFDDAAVSATYLDGVVKQGCRSSSVYSYLMSLLSAMDDEEPLYTFLSTHVPHASSTVDAIQKALRSPQFTAQNELSSPLDMSYALRTVLKTGRHFRSAIKLYMGFGMRQQAVELALKVDPTLARELAQDSVQLEERKRLWLMIAKSAAFDGSRTGKDVVGRVVGVLNDCGSDVLTIEDVLPFMPDFASINQIKDEICEALTSYSSKIEGFLMEMGDCDQTCENIRDDIKRVRNHNMHMKADAVCALTNKTALSSGEPFYIFPSGYVVLANPLMKEVLPYLTRKQRDRVGQLQSLLQSRSSSTGSEKYYEMQAEFDGLIAAECPLTGFLMVESIDRDFEDSDENISCILTSVERVEV